MDLAAAAAGDRVTRMSLGGRPEQLADVGRSDLELRGLNDTTLPPGAGRRVSPTHGTRSHYICQSPGHGPGNDHCRLGASFLFS